jgi:pimeloyl-ACP methyl ester carboxylesterase
MADDLTPRGRPMPDYLQHAFDAERLPDEVRAPLARYRGEIPPAPEWFDWAIAQQPERGFVNSNGTRIETLAWGDRGKPGILFVHGSNAHADWWAPLAPFFTEDYRVAALSLAGMGESDWRDSYSFRAFAEDAETVARATGLYEGGGPPVYIGHSFGGAQVYFTAANHPERMRAAIVVDTSFSGPPAQVMEQRRQRVEKLAKLPPADRPTWVYPSLADALARFRLMPPQPVENTYMLDFIARRSLKPAPGGGFSWKFDPQIWEKLDRSGENVAEPGSIKVPVVHLCGDKSPLVKGGSGGEFGSLNPGLPEIEIPDSHHHVMIDQPLALIAAIRATLALWAH